MDTSVMRELINKSGKMQKEIAADLGLSQPRFNYYVNGSREPDSESQITLMYRQIFYLEELPATGTRHNPQLAFGFPSSEKSLPESHLKPSNALPTTKKFPQRWQHRANILPYK